MKLKEITQGLQRWAPLAYQESYDNSGLLTGDPHQEIQQALITLDVTEKVVDEAIETGAELIVAHHPLIFKGLKKITPDHWLSRCLIKAIKHDIAIYAIHTNLDNVHTGVNARICQRLGLKNTRILAPKTNQLQKLTVFIPTENVDRVLQAMYEAGAGKIGNYDHCSFQVSGTGTFRPGEAANPTIGQQLEDETVEEKRVEVIFPSHQFSSIYQAMVAAHPYEEVAYYLSSLENAHQEVGAGMIGQLPNKISAKELLQRVKGSMGAGVVKHTRLVHEKVKTIAVCGGAGGFLLPQAIRAGADVFITSDLKYHEFFEANQEIILADIGHYESEQFTKDLLYDHFQENFANIAVRLSKVITNPIYYL
jgi:dinuclear metal center YbgI/SA1388 family protein